MATNKVTFAGLKLKTDTSTTEMTFNDQIINVKNYLSIGAKYDLVTITLQEAKEDGIYNPIKLDLFFTMNLIYMYTDLVFTEKQKEDVEKTYDALKSNGFIDVFLQTLKKSEYDDCFMFLNDTRDDILSYRNTAGAVLQSIIQDLPKNAEAAAKIVDTFDKNKYQEVIDFAAAANGGRPVPIK